MSSQQNLRKSVRMDCHHKAVVTWDGRSFDGTIVNQSVSNGEMYFCVHFPGSHFPYAEPGEECLLMFGENGQHKYATKAVRVGADKIVLATASVRRWLAERGGQGA